MKIELGPRPITVVENVWIPLSDGTRLAAKVWLPEDADHNPVPVLMDYIPYRKRENTNGMYPYLASYGYACVRPDIRGSGDSEGRPQDEYAKQEQDDGVEIIAWLARQPWCTGKVGMFGISWGGNSALQVAARRPPELKAIITVCSSDDLYPEEPYTGGLLNDTVFFEWGVRWPAFCGRPPDPAIVGERWRDMWIERLNNLDYYPINWIAHQHRDAFWKHRSISEDHGAIQCAVYAVGGWNDIYYRAIPRMLANLKCPRKGLIGPWGHQHPNNGDPGPAIDWLTEALRWWDHWLKDIDTGIMTEPMYRVWMQQESTMRGIHQSPGCWVAEDSWPSPRIKPHQLYLTNHGLESDAGAESAHVLNPLQTVGITAPRRHWRDIDTEAPTDQRIDDARSLTFDSEPLEGNLEILGQPAVTIELAVDKPVAFLAVRLNEVEPDGLSKRITYGVLNLTHRDSDEFPEPLEPGKRYRIRMPLQDCAHVFKTGRRIRVAVSTTYWPAFWPSPEPVTLTVYAGRSELELPVRPPRAEDGNLKPFGPAFVPAPTSGRTVLQEAPAPTRVSEWDAATSKLTIRTAWDGGQYRIEAIGTEVGSITSEVVEILDQDPTSANVQTQYIETLKRGDWNVRVESSLRMSLTKDSFLLVGQLRALDHDAEIFTRTWNRTIPRMLV
ncbi:CocE/NonD family hydrolase [Phyllobacterium zundukense]|uniref:Peptidase S15 n=1 Tax=Phyllobacterium zundukense TaxID=1867719 RepID=A0A2N9VUQ2_9HYPH|nr:CocE/NonD family hydrolase [Phyllobacterium zundukense]ATU95323.1 peptidase S15 [Phyllobacterium zundukense]PIO43220.1 peptidase S15 [Phyllobacterium zundukense]